MNAQSKRAGGGYTAPAQVHIEAGWPSGMTLDAKVVFPPGKGPEDTLAVFTALEQLEAALGEVQLVNNAERQVTA